MSSNSPGQVQLWLVRVLLVQFLKWWKWAMNVRSYVFLKMLLFLKMLSLVLNLLTQMLIYSCVVVRRGPTAVYEEGQRNLISSPVMGRFCGRELSLWSGVPPSSAKLPWSRVLIYIIVFCAIEFNTCSSPNN